MLLDVAHVDICTHREERAMSPELLRGQAWIQIQFKETNSSYINTIFFSFLLVFFFFRLTSELLMAGKKQASKPTPLCPMNKLTLLAILHGKLKYSSSFAYLNVNLHSICLVVFTEHLLSLHNCTPECLLW